MCKGENQDATVRGVKELGTAETVPNFLFSWCFRPARALMVQHRVILAKGKVFLLKILCEIKEKMDN